jgi:hypothetical protein
VFPFSCSAFCFFLNETRAKSGFISGVSFFLCFDFDPTLRGLSQKKENGKEPMDGSGWLRCRIVVGRPFGDRPRRKLLFYYFSLYLIHESHMNNFAGRLVIRCDSRNMGKKLQAKSGESKFRFREMFCFVLNCQKDPLLSLRKEVTHRLISFLTRWNS